MNKTINNTTTPTHNTQKEKNGAMKLTKKQKKNLNQ